MKNVFVGAAFAALTLLTWLQFPGHTWLQQDSQIYVPILEHLRDPSLLNNDILVQHPHVAFTLYDEVTLILERVTGLDVRRALSVQQIVTRALGIWGVYLIATALGLNSAPALLVSAIWSLGATIVGPAVLTTEYEPTPRAFAVPLLFLAMGLLAQGRDTAAGSVASVAFLYHPPTTLVFWGVCLVWTIRERRFRALAPLACAIAILLLAVHFQAGIRERQELLTRLDPALEKLQRMRAGYNWISYWWRDMLPHYLLLYAGALAAAWRLRNSAGTALRWLMFGMPLAGILSVPLSWILLEGLKWSLIPQIQPTRALLFVTSFAMILGAAAGCTAVRDKRYLEAFVWFALAYLAPVNARIFQFGGWNRVAVVATLAALACVSLRVRRFAPVVAALTAFFVIPIFGRVMNYPMLHSPELGQLSQWARVSTQVNSVFLFADSGKGLLPGIFRSEGLRAVYVDWKGGGQVNFLPQFAAVWWSRWQTAMSAPFAPDTIGRYTGLGIDYLVLTPKNPLPGAAPVFQNSKFLVYALTARPVLAGTSPQTARNPAAPRAGRPPATNPPDPFHKPRPDCCEAFSASGGNTRSQNAGSPAYRRYLADVA